MAFSWLQKRQVKVVARGSRCGRGKLSYAGDEAQNGKKGKVETVVWRTFFGPCGLRDDFFRLPYTWYQLTTGELGGVRLYCSTDHGYE